MSRCEEFTKCGHRFVRCENRAAVGEFPRCFKGTPMQKKLMLGHKVRRLRRTSGLTQLQMAEQLGISPSYLNLLEHNQRPVTTALLLRLVQNFRIDLQRFARE